MLRTRRTRIDRKQLALWLGIAALIAQLLAGATHLLGSRAPAPGAISSGLIEVCTPQGLTLVDALTGKIVSPPDGQQRLATRCCDLCGAGDAPAIAEADPGRVRDVVYQALPGPRPAQPLALTALHPALSPLVPRAPPAAS